MVGFITAAPENDVRIGSGQFALALVQFVHETGAKTCKIRHGAANLQKLRVLERMSTSAELIAKKP